MGKGYRYCTVQYMITIRKGFVKVVGSLVKPCERTGLRPIKGSADWLARQSDLEAPDWVAGVRRGS